VKGSLWPATNRRILERTVVHGADGCGGAAVRACNSGQLGGVGFAVFTRNDWRWLFVAIGYHLIVDAVAVVGVLSLWPALVIEAAVRRSRSSAWRSF